MLCVLAGGTGLGSAPSTCQAVNATLPCFTLLCREGERYGHPRSFPLTPEACEGRERRQNPPFQLRPSQANSITANTTHRLQPPPAPDTPIHAGCPTHAPAEPRPTAQPVCSPLPLHPLPAAGHRPMGTGWAHAAPHAPGTDSSRVPAPTSAAPCGTARRRHRTVGQTLP